jgi:hypothetical protein
MKRISNFEEKSSRGVLDTGLSAIDFIFSQ